MHGTGHEMLAVETPLNQAIKVCSSSVWSNDRVWILKPRQLLTPPTITHLFWHLAIVAISDLLLLMLSSL
jgi:hypothetical protein